MKRPLIALVFSMIAASSFAEDAKLTREFSECMKGSVSTSDMLNCHGDEVKRQDVFLNKNYKAAMQTSSQSRKKELKEVQRVWLKYRELNCNFYEDPDGGTSGLLASASCFLTQTANRASELKLFVD